MIEKIKQPIRVSVVDDEEDLLEILSINLKSEGYEVQKFISGNQFLNEILNGKDLPDLVLLDIMMDGINGLDVCRKMRMDIRFQTIPVIFLTAKTGIKDKIQGLEWGGDDYITKPFNIKELLLRVKAVLKRIPKDMEIGDIQNIFTYKDLTVKRDSFL
ncbi:MAG TPA: response regulator transcription factor, partial [Spirochaetes bacterium]|nr:response regulator transcription factor [Spirochaetota bacterium]